MMQSWLKLYVRGRGAHEVIAALQPAKLAAVSRTCAGACMKKHTEEKEP